MNNKEKINEIEVILKDLDEKRCPYCHSELKQFFHREERRFGCDGNKIHLESLEIRMIDYIYAIELIVKYGDMKTPPNRRLTEFL